MENTNMISNMAQTALENILTRTSDRLFVPGKTVEAEKIESILKAAMAAPSGVNRQPWHFFVVSDRNLLCQLADALPYCKMAKDAGVAIVVCGDKTRFLDGDDATLWVQDVSAASENILLAAHALGLGSVWTALYPHQDRMEHTRKILDIDGNFVPFNVIPIGYVRTPHHPIDKFRSSAITYR